MSDIQGLRKAAWAIFLATDEKVAQDLADKLNGAADELTQLRTDIKRLASQNSSHEKTIVGLYKENERLKLDKIENDLNMNGLRADNKRLRKLEEAVKKLDFDWLLSSCARIITGQDRQALNDLKELLP